jgi:hypothetical protein
VGVPILEKHYTPRRQKRDTNNATVIAAVLGPFTSVLHHDEAGRQITDLGEASSLTEATRIVQKFGQLYSLQLVRWLGFIISDLSHVGAYERRIQALLGLNEPFVPYMNEDSYLKGRTSWVK